MAQRWHDRAERYRSLSKEFAQRGFYPESCFFAHQAVEFLLKGRLIELSGSRPYTHSILALIRQLSSLMNKELSEDVTKCAKVLTEQYIESRYPDAKMLDYDRGDAEECVRCMELVFSYVA